MFQKNEPTRDEILYRIREISADGAGNPLEQRELLNHFINELKRITNYVTPVTYPIDKIAGSWKQIFTDQIYPMPAYLELDEDYVYQIVSKENHYWNISRIDLLGIVPTVGCLRGKYECIPGEPSVNVEFTKSGFRPGYFPGYVPVTEYANSLESGNRWVFSFGSGVAPSGPVGITGKLTSVYVDSEIRIDMGEQYDLKDEAGKVLIKGFAGTLFILEKVGIFL